MSTKKTAINKRDKVCPLKESVFWTANKSILSVMLSFYCAFKLNEYEETQKYALIIVAVSILFYIVAVML